MRACSNSSVSSAACRLEWRPSRWSMAACGVLSGLAVASLWISELPGWLALAGSGLAAGWGVRRIWRERDAKPFELVIPWDPDRPVVVAGRPADTFDVEWRGPLAMLRWSWPGRRRDGRLWWPDLLPPPARRELRLAAAARAVPPARPQMAP